MPLGVGGSPWWTPGSDSPYGGNQTAWGRSMLESSPQTAWYRFGRTMGVPDDGSAFSRWFSSQYPQFQQGYNAYTVSDPLNANIVDYLNSLGGYQDWYRQFQAQAPQLRGLNPGSRGGGPVRWVPWV